MQPFIRYDTGDLVRRVKNSCQPGLTFEFAGKAKNCVSWTHFGRIEWLILSAALHEILDSIPDFQRVEQFRGVRSASDPSVGSLSIYTLDPSSSKPGLLLITFTAELRYAPQFYPERTAELEHIIHKGLANSHPDLAFRMGEEEVQFQAKFVGPGALAGRNLLKI